MKQDLSKLRKNYNSGELNENNLHAGPFLQFDAWFNEALKKEPFEPNAMVLSTSGGNNMLSSRVVLLKGYSEKGFVFFTNYRSRKGEEISKNPYVALLFFWPQLQRQVRIEGHIKKTTRKESEEYFNSRPLENRVAAIVSKQSCKIESYEEFIKSIENKLKEDKIQRPEYWGGYCVIPSRFEFWQGRPGRLHDRFQFVLEKKNWKVERLYP